MIDLGVSAVAQWVKNLTAVAWVAEEAWVRSLARHRELSCICSLD